MKGIPEQIQTWLDGREWEENHIGMSDSRVLTAEDRVLKIQRVSPEAELPAGYITGTQEFLLRLPALEMI